ncbi:MAG: ABC transporter ATP-binding protein [Christensenellaceae bacterium]|jgi:ABC-2 type transport system ATP-binding protein|nr:ABC transporter ATP-binding protein [Christensenellaceae bacterium]
MLKISAVTKTFLDKVAKTPKIVLDNINLEIKDGEVYGLVGANGAGKTTLMNIISRVLKEDGGTIEIDGVKMGTINDISGKVGYMLDIPAMFDFMTAHEYFEYLSSPQKKDKKALKTMTDYLLGEVGLSDVAGKYIKKYSRGMKQRLGIAAALISNPQIILMDEPSSALDPQGRYEVLKIIERLRERGKTIILSTHILSDVERVCDRVGLLSKGKLVVEGTLHDVLKRFSENAFVVLGDDTELVKVEAALKKIKDVKEIRIISESMEIVFEEGKQEKIFEIITGASNKLTSVSLKVSTVEDIFLKAQKGEV